MTIAYTRGLLSRVFYPALFLAFRRAGGTSGRGLLWTVNRSRPPHGEWGQHVRACRNSCRCRPDDPIVHPSRCCSRFLLSGSNKAAFGTMTIERSRHPGCQWRTLFHYHHRLALLRVSTHGNYAGQLFGAAAAYLMIDVLCVLLRDLRIFLSRVVPDRWPPWASCLCRRAVPQRFAAWRE